MYTIIDVLANAYTYVYNCFFFFGEDISETHIGRLCNLSDFILSIDDVWETQMRHVKNYFEKILEFDSITDKRSNLRV